MRKRGDVFLLLLFFSPLLLIPFPSGEGRDENEDTELEMESWEKKGNRDA